MFIYGGLLKFVGDLTALVGPISITQIVEYIQINLNASLSAPTPTPPTQSFSLANDVYVSHKTAINFYNNYNSTANNRKEYQTNDYADLSSALSLTPETEFTTINEYTGIYYPNWVDFIGNGWIMAMLVLYATLIQGSLSQASTHIVNMIGIRLRTSLQSLVYRKTLLISTSCFFENAANRDSNTVTTTPTNSTTERKETKAPANTSSSGKQPQPQPIFDTGTITNLMSEDALNIMSFFWIAHYVWAIPIKVRLCYHTIFYFPFFSLYRVFPCNFVVSTLVISSSCKILERSNRTTCKESL